MTDRILRLPAVLAAVGVSRSTLYDAAARGLFPKPIRLMSSKSVGWRQSEVDAWLSSRETSPIKLRAG